MKEWKFQHSSPSTTYWLFWQTLHVQRQDGQWTPQLIILWGVLACPRIYAVFPFPSFIFPAGLLVGFCLSSVIPLTVSFMGCPHWSRLWNRGQEWKLFINLITATTFSERRNVIFTLDFQESFNKIKLSAVILLWYVPLFVLWADTCSFKTAEFTNKKGRIQKLCRMPAVALQCRNEVGENNFLLFLPWRKKDNEQHSLQTFRDLKGGHSTLGLNAHLSHQDREKSRNPCHCCENAEEEYWAQGASQWCKRSRRKRYRTGYCNKKWKGEQPGMLCRFRFCMDPSNRPRVESGTCADPCRQWITLEDKVLLTTQARLLIFGQTWGCWSPCSATLCRALLGRADWLGAAITFLETDRSKACKRGNGSCASGPHALPQCLGSHREVGRGRDAVFICMYFAIACRPWELLDCCWFAF